MLDTNAMKQKTSAKKCASHVRHAFVTKTEFGEDDWCFLTAPRVTPENLRIFPAFSRTGILFFLEFSTGHSEGKKGTNRAETWSTGCRKDRSILW